MNNLTVGELKECISDLPSDMEITFGSSRYSKRPLIFYRFKSRGDDLLQIELNELEPEGWRNESELDYRITVGYLREHLIHYKNTDKITFGSTVDAIEIIPDKPRVVFSFNLNQPAE
ncbi:hypothetical protein [Aeromonas salmonicida]|uniref:hypothetical protein n=1 Tax=Aeromonas salmonicida TaxID=645 RepID=UPI0030CC1D52